MEFYLRFMRIYFDFDVTTFDRITKDRSARFVDMLSAIGGTMGLLTWLLHHLLYIQDHSSNMKKTAKRKTFN